MKLEDRSIINLDLQKRSMIKSNLDCLTTDKSHNSCKRNQSRFLKISCWNWEIHFALQNEVAESVECSFTNATYFGDLFEDNAHMVNFLSCSVAQWMAIATTAGRCVKAKGSRSFFL